MIDHVEALCPQRAQNSEPQKEGDQCGWPILRSWTSALPASSIVPSPRAASLQYLERHRHWVDWQSL